MPGTSSKTPCVGSANGPSRSSSDPMPQAASRSCRADGSSNAPSHGSIVIDGSLRTSSKPSHLPAHGCSSHRSSSLLAASQGSQNQRLSFESDTQVLGFTSAQTKSFVVERNCSPDR